MKCGSGDASNEGGEGGLFRAERRRERRNDKKSKRKNENGRRSRSIGPRPSGRLCRPSAIRETERGAPFGAARQSEGSRRRKTRRAPRTFAHPRARARGARRGFRDGVAPGVPARSGLADWRDTPAHSPQLALGVTARHAVRVPVAATHRRGRPEERSTPPTEQSSPVCPRE